MFCSVSINQRSLNNKYKHSTAIQLAIQLAAILALVTIPAILVPMVRGEVCYKSHVGVPSTAFNMPEIPK